MQDPGIDLRRAWPVNLRRRHDGEKSSWQDWCYPMSKSIGFRVDPTAIHYAVVEGTPEDPVLLDDGRYGAPRTYDEATALSWYRQRTITLLETHKPDKGAIKFMENVAGPGRVPRITESLRRRHRIEGVVLQLLHETRVSTLAGPFATVAARLGTQSAKAYLDSEELRGIDWRGKPKNVKEAVLAAVAAITDRE